MVNEPIHPHVAVVGGGIAGSTIALRLAHAGVDVVLLEKGRDLVAGPPMCHLHAGGCLYPELDDEDCRTLLRQSVEMAAMHPFTIDARPTVVCVPRRDGTDPVALGSRFVMLRGYYDTLVRRNPSLAVLGPVEDYVASFEAADLAALAAQGPACDPQTPAEWLSIAMSMIDVGMLKTPIHVVAEPGWNILRLAASTALQLAAQPLARVELEATCVGAERGSDGWEVTWERAGERHVERVHHLVNACGFRTGLLDDLAGVGADRGVEVKASFLARWDRRGPCPEMVFHGERDTPTGMAQVTPQPGGLVQLHGMVQGATLFPGGLTKADAPSAQPPVAPEYVDWIDHGWDTRVVTAHTRRALEHAAVFVPALGQAESVGCVLGGGQQIPSGDVAARVGHLRWLDDLAYGIAENVKACSALDLADDVVEALVRAGCLPMSARRRPVWDRVEEADIVELARVMATRRGIPVAMADITTPAWLCRPEVDEG